MYVEKGFIIVLCSVLPRASFHTAPNSPPTLEVSLLACLSGLELAKNRHGVG